MLQRHYTSLRMVDAQCNLNEQPNEGNFATGFECYILLKKDGKTICRTRCLNPLIQMPLVWTISNIVRQKPDVIVSGLPQYREFAHIAIFNISYIRGLFPEKYLNDKSVPTLVMNRDEDQEAYTNGCKVLQRVESSMIEEYAFTLILKAKRFQ
ncbi:Meiosis-specific protein ASY1 [Camellia lanceoleosa]|uniref:Meiosis-specific protein ASY1 n=1 Tax=Camellia lanceoleosa TaxID=1840588 RepID=A0ACC0FGT0_9ERIC|nr:Meiosis-specific protein ASY1 [Camellia lanceoleosa]